MNWKPQNRPDCPFLPGYEPRPIYLGEGISWTPSVRTAKALAMQEARRQAPVVRPSFDRFLIQGYPGGPIYYRPQMGGAA